MLPAHVRERFLQPAAGSAQNGRRRFQIAFDCRRRTVLRRRRAPLRFEEQLRLSQQALADHPRTGAPGAIQLSGLTRIAVVLRERRGHALAIRQAGPRHRSEKPHRYVRRDLAFAHLLLDRLRQLFHQRQPPRYPAHTPIETARQFLEPVAKTLLHLRQQPPLLQRRLPFRPPRAAVQQ